MDEKVDEQTGQKNQYPSVHDRMKQPDYEDITYPLAEGAAPAIVDLAMWEAAQQAIKRNRMFGGKITRENSPHREQSTLLHGGFVYCTRCGGMMTRHWRSEYAEPKPSYRCTARASSPTHACAIHDINARVVDRIVLQRLAIALTDPEQLVELADAAEQQAAQAAAEVERAGTALAVYREMDAEREKARKGYMEAIAALSAIPGGANRETITDLRAKLARLDKDGAKLTRNANDLRRSKSAPFVVNEC